MRRVVFTLVMTVMLASPASAQDSPAPVLEFSAGWLGFADDGIVGESMVGGAARFYVRPRIGVGPEIAYIKGENHSHLMLTGNMSVDLLPSAGASRPITPFVVVGGGLFQTREQSFSGPFTSSEGAFTAGGGVRALVGDRVMLGAEARIGWELHLRISGTVGVALGR